MRGSHAHAAFRAGGIPAVYVVNRGGRIAFATVGYNSGIGRELTAALAKP